MRFKIAFALCLLVGCDQGTLPPDHLPSRDGLSATVDELDAGQLPTPAVLAAAMAPAHREGMDGGAVDGGAVDGGGSSETPSATGASQGRTAVGPSNPEGHSATLADPARELDGISPWSNQSDAGVAPPPPPPPTPEPDPSVGDVVDTCSGCAGACDTGTSDSCASGNNGDDPCATTSEDSGSAESCDNASADSGQGCASASDSSDAATCQVSRGRGHKTSGTCVWLLAPLAYLLMVRRS